MNIQSKFTVYFITLWLYSSILSSLLSSTSFDEVASLNIFIYIYKDYIYIKIIYIYIKIIYIYKDYIYIYKDYIYIKIIYIYICVYI